MLASMTRGAAVISLPVWRALSTKDGGEIVSGDSY